MGDDFLEEKPEIADIDTARVKSLAERGAVRDEYGMFEQVFDQKRYLNVEQKVACFVQQLFVLLDLVGLFVGHEMVRFEKNSLKKALKITK